MTPSSATLTRFTPSPTALRAHDRGLLNGPRVWIVGAGYEPFDLPTVRDTAMRIWEPGTDGLYHSADGWHHVSWHELRRRFDLVEVI